MPGFAGIVNTDNISNNIDTLVTDEKSNFVYNRITNYNCDFRSSTIKKFLDDKLFVDDIGKIYCFDGLFLNKDSLRSKHSVKSTLDLFKKMEIDDPVFFKTFRGTFAGFIFNKSLRKLTLFDDHFANKPVYYFFDKEKNGLFFATEMSELTRILGNAGYRLKVSELGAYYLLTFGFMLRDETIVEGVRKLAPGSFLTYQNGRIEVNEYYRLQNPPKWELEEEKIINELDTRFKMVISEEYSKDTEYGYNHIATLSGGLDSRTNIFYARKCGFEDILAITFSDSRNREAQIAKKIAADLGLTWLFMSLDSGNYLKDIEAPSRISGGGIIYSGSAHALRMERLIDWSSFGVLHTGQVGLVLGSNDKIDLSDKKKVTHSLSKAGYSSGLIEKIPENVLMDVAESSETFQLFVLYQRCVNGTIFGDLVAQQFTETASPFMHVDFIEYSIGIDPSFRVNKQIYQEWITRKTPEACKRVYANTGLRIGANRSLVRSRNFMTYFLRKLGFIRIDSMNPFNYWYKTNNSLRETFEDYYREHIDSLSKHPELQRDVEKMFNDGTPLEKTQPLTLLAAIKLHGLEK